MLCTLFVMPDKKVSLSPFPMAKKNMEIKIFQWGETTVEMHAKTHIASNYHPVRLYLVNKKQ